MAVTANKIDIEFAQVAQEKSKNKEILQFAQTMTNDHTAVINQAVALVQKLGVTPVEHAVGKQLLAEAENTKQDLRAKSGAAFDKAYIDNEVAYHKSVISAVQDLLIPESDNADLRGFLESVVPALKAHLEHAEMVQKHFNKK